MQLVELLPLTLILSPKGKRKSYISVVSVPFRGEKILHFSVFFSFRGKEICYFVYAEIALSQRAWDLRIISITSRTAPLPPSFLVV